MNRRCTKCRKNFPSTLEYFYFKKGGKYNLTAVCKQCERLKGFKYYLKNKEKIKVTNKLYYQKNKKKIALKSKQWQRANPEKVRIISARFHKNHPERTLAWHLKWVKNNPEAANKLNKNYRKSHPEAYKKMYIKQNNKRKRNFGFKILFENPFDITEKTEWHHLNNKEVIAIPKDLHHLYLGKFHREKTMEIVKQIYNRR